MNAMRAVLISDAKLSHHSAARLAVLRHALIQVKLTICLHDWLRKPMLLNSAQGDLAVVTLTDRDQQLPGLILNAAKQPVPVPTIVAVGSSDVYIVEAAREGAFCGNTWVDASSDGVDAALHHIVDASVRPVRSVSVVGSALEEVRLSVQQAIVLFLLSHGFSGQRIGQLLGISAKTVSSHKRRVMDKLVVDNLPDLIRIADRNQAGLFAVAESVLGAQLRTVILARPAYIEPLRLALRPAPDRSAR